MNHAVASVTTAALPAQQMKEGDSACCPCTISLSMQHWGPDAEMLTHTELLVRLCRDVPVSTVLPEERFLFKAVPNAPGFYRAVARYGCARSISPAHAVHNRAALMGRQRTALTLALGTLEDILTWEWKGGLSRSHKGHPVSAAQSV